jgi:hypothetical protein
MINNMQRNLSTWLFIATLLVAAVVQANMIISSTYMAIAMSAAFFFLMLFFNAPLGLLMIMLFIFPFSGTEAFRAALADIPGFKPLQLLSLALMAVALMNLRNAVRPPAAVVFFFMVIIVVFSITFLRSLPNLDNINQIQTERLSVMRYFLSEYFKHMIYFIPAIIIAHFVYTARDLERVASTINWSITLLSVVIITFYFINADMVQDPRDTRRLYSESFGLHTNSIVNYYILGFPFILAELFRKKSLIPVIKIALCAAAVAFLFSRSAYFLLVASFFIYLYLSKRARWLPVVVLLILASILIIPESVKQRATKGFETGDRNELLAGRVDHIWLPLLEEAAGSDPKTILFGNGRYAMVSTDVHKKRSVIQAMHPHNMYLEAFLDAGLVGLLIMLSLFAYLVVKAYRHLKLAENTPYKEYLIATITAVLCFLISGMTDRTFFPDEINGYLWVIVGLALVLCRQIRVMKAASAPAEAVTVAR